MLSDKLRQSGQTLEKLRNQKEFKENQKQIQNNLNTVREEIREMEEQINWIKNFQSVTELSVDLKLKQIGQKHLNEIEKSVRGLKDFNTVISIKSEFKKEFSKLLDNTWNSYYKDRIDQTVKTLEFVSDLDKSQIQPLMNILKNSKKRPGTKTEIKVVITTLDKAEAVIKNLNLNDEIKLFLRKLRNRQATLESLTPEISNWLKENNLFRVIKLSI